MLGVLRNPLITKSSALQKRSFAAVGTFAVRSMRCRIEDEESADELDKALREAVQTIWPKVPGVLGIDRALCRNEWEYLVTVKFESKEALDSFMQSEVMKKELYPHMQKLSHLYLGGMKAVHWQNLLVEKFM